MRFPFSFLWIAALLAGQESTAPADWQQWHERGVEAYRTARYPEAAEALQKAIDLNSDDIAGHVFLARTWLAQYVPGDTTAKNQQIANRATAEFDRVLNTDPENKAAMLALGSLNYLEAQTTTDANGKRQRTQAARYWYERIVALDPQEKQAYCSLGVMAWSEWFPKWVQARSQVGMKPSDPGPIADAAARQQLRDQNISLIENGIADLEKTLAIDPKDEEALSYINLFVWTSADLRDTKEEYLRDMQRASEWDRRLRECQNKDAGGQTVILLSPEAFESGALLMPNQRTVRVPRLILARQVDPVYPPLARQSGIMGAVRFRVFIRKDGRVQNPQFITGNPLLVDAARQALAQWVYQPVVVNGAPADVATEVDVKFSLVTP